jgi:hypothetical protein
VTSLINKREFLAADLVLGRHPSILAGGVGVQTRRTAGGQNSRAKGQRGGSTWPKESNLET